MLVEEDAGTFVFEKRTVLQIDAANPHFLSVRPSESLELLSCSGSSQ